MNRTLYLIGAAAIVAIGAYGYLRPADVATAPATAAPAEETALVQIRMPVIEGDALIGARIFGNICAACHGENGVGVDGSGPPLIHKIYEPSHHADESFQRAVALGVRGHHWKFGDMPPVEGLTRGDVNMIIQYIRTIQRANGIS